MSSDVYKLFSECTNFEESIKILKSFRCNQNSTGWINLGSISSSIACSGKIIKSKMLLLKFTKRKLLKMPLFLGYSHFLFNRLLENKTAILTEAWNQTLIVERAILNCEAYSDTQTTYQVVSVLVSPQQHDAFSFHQEKNQKEDSDICC